VESIVTTSSFSEAQSLSIAPSNSRPSRCDMIVMPLVADRTAQNDLVTRTGLVAEMLTSFSMMPIPVVVMKI